MGIFDRGQLFRRLEPRSIRPENTIERLCREIGWLFVGQEGDHYRVRTADRQSSVYLDVKYSEHTVNTLIASWFPIRFSLERPPAGLFARLLLRSIELRWSSWQMSIGGSSEACLCVSATLPTGSLKASLFHIVCKEVADEIRAFHLELHNKFAYAIGIATSDPLPRHTPSQTLIDQDGDPGIRFLE